MWLVVAILFSLVAWAGLILAMPRHHRQIWRRNPGPVTSRAYRVMGIVCLGVAYVACGFECGWIVGPVAWLCVLSMTAIAVVCLLSAVASVTN